MMSATIPDRDPVPAPLVSFVIPVRNDAARLRRCLESVNANAPNAGPFEIIVVDNGSTDDSIKVALAAGARVIDAPGILVGQVRNRGARAAQGAYLAFVDADHELHPTWLREALSSIEQDGAAAVGASYLAPPGGTWVQRMYGALRTIPRGRHRVLWLGSGSLLVRRKAFEATGGYDAQLTTCEDVDFCQRLEALDLPVVSDARLNSVHHGDPKTLTALFRGELWRGRNNFKVTLRGPWRLRPMISLFIPLVNLVMITAFISGVFAAPWGGWKVSAAALAVMLSLSLLRTIRMVSRAGQARLGEVHRAFAVAWVYDVARALALIARAGHSVRRDRATG